MNMSLIIFLLNRWIPPRLSFAEMKGHQIPQSPLPLSRKEQGELESMPAVKREIKSPGVGFTNDEDYQYCLARHEAYYFWNKHTGSYNLHLEQDIST